MENSEKELMISYGTLNFLFLLKLMAMTLLAVTVFYFAEIFINYETFVSLVEVPADQAENSLTFLCYLKLSVIIFTIYKYIIKGIEAFNGLVEGKRIVAENIERRNQKINFEK